MPQSNNTAGIAIEGLKAGRKARRNWWDEGRFIYLVPSSEFNVNREPLLSFLEEGTPVHYRAHIDVINRFGNIEPFHWSVDDLLAEDWEVD